MKNWFGFWGCVYVATFALSTASILYGEPEKEDALQALTIANNDFSVALYKQILKDDDNGISSPFSVLTVLAMLLEGANGVSAHQIRVASRLRNLGKDDMEAAFAKLLASLRQGEGHELSVANSVWVRESFDVLQDFKTKLKEIFDAEERPLDLLTGVRDVNQWVDVKTNHKIPSLLSEIPRDTVVILLNAIYFKGKWQTAFDKDKNTEEVFKNYEIREKPTTFMNSRKRMFYGESEALNAQVLELPYRGDDISMVVFLPRKGSTLVELEKKMTVGDILDATKKLYKNMVQLSLPKFKIESNIDLQGPLEALGLKDVFTDKADLTGISSKSPLKVTKVLQKATIEVNEEGSEASAATAVLVGLRTAHVSYFDDPVEFRANHPFMYVLLHKPTNTILFMGRYMAAK